MLAEDVFREANELLDQAFFFQFKVSRSDLLPAYAAQYVESLEELRSKIRQVPAYIKPYRKTDIKTVGGSCTFVSKASW